MWGAAPCYHSVSAAPVQKLLSPSPVAWILAFMAPVGMAFSRVEPWSTFVLL